MNTCITGCAGFLGARLAKELVSGDNYVVGLSRRECASASTCLAIDLASDRAPTQLMRLAKEVGYPDVVVHAAARQPGPYAYSEYVRSNLLATAHLLDALEHFLTTRIIYTSTLSVYGRPETNPVPESCSVRPDGPYAVTKWSCEKLLETFRQHSQVIVLRLPSMYGAGQADSFIDGLARRVIEDEIIELFDGGKIARDALHVDDVVAAISTCIESPLQAPFCLLNLGCGRRITTSDYARTLVSTFSSGSAIVPVDRPGPQPFDLYADISEARRQIHFNPTGLEESLARYVHELRS